MLRRAVLLAASPPAGAAVAGDVVYTGSYASALRRLKRLSLSGCITTLVGAPVLYGMASHAATAVKVGVPGIVMAFGVSTTVILNFLTRTYVTRARVLPDQPAALQVETLNFLGLPRPHTILQAAAERTDGWPPFSNFSVASRPFYLDPDRAQDARVDVLRARIAGLAPEPVDAGGDDDEDEDEDGEAQTAHRPPSPKPG